MTIIKDVILIDGYKGITILFKWKRGTKMRLFGRTKIYTTSDITIENIVDELKNALSVHYKNVAEEDYLFWYRRGKQPIINRRKQIRKEINNKVCENHSQEIVTFKNGYFLSEPACYRARKKNKNKEVDKLNEFLYLSGKHDADNEIVDSFHTMGLGVCYLTGTEDGFAAYSLDPRQAFCVYSRKPGEEPVMGINMVNSGKSVLFDVFTKTDIFHLVGTKNKFEVTSVEVNPYGEIPIVEYMYENTRMGAFESVITLLDELNNIQSNSADGIEQFIQSLMIFYNCELGDDENGNPITPSYIRESGAMFLKTNGQDKADLKILTEQLDQSQTQVLKDNLYEQILHIVGMPAPSTNDGSTSDNTGAVIWRSGWYQADTYARNTEDLFVKSNRRFDRVMLAILKAKNLIKLDLNDFELQFTRSETDTLYVRTQTCLNMRELGFSPEIAFARSGVSNDPVADVINSKQYIDLKWGTDVNRQDDSGNQPGTIAGQDGGSED